MKKLLLLLFSLFLIAFCVIPADAWVASGGAYNGAAVGPRGGSVYGPNGGGVGARPYGGCCSGGYNGYNVAGPSVATAKGGAARCGRRCYKIIRAWYNFFRSTGTDWAKGRHWYDSL